MKNPLDAILVGGEVHTYLYPPQSRYSGVATTTTEQGDRPVVHLRRRFLPQPERAELVSTHSVADGDRLDRIAAAYFGDPELFWRICDANGATFPVELLEELGRRIRITRSDRG